MDSAVAHSDALDSLERISQCRSVCVGEGAPAAAASAFSMLRTRTATGKGNPTV